MDYPLPNGPNPVRRDSSGSVPAGHSFLKDNFRLVKLQQLVANSRVHAGNVVVHLVCLAASEWTVGIDGCSKGPSQVGS